MTGDRPFRRGDFVTLRAHGARTDAMVTLASENGRSLMVMFDGMFSAGAEGSYAGMMPLVQQDDGTFVELVHHQPVQIERKPR